MYLEMANGKGITSEERNNPLLYQYLPIHMIRKNYVLGEDDCDYEIYLREFLNESEYFKELSEQEMYVKPLTESNGEPDAVTSKYCIDFKLMISSTKMNASRNLSYSITKMDDGAYSFALPKRSGEMEYTSLYVALRYRDCDNLEEIDRNTSGSRIEKDIKAFLDKMKTKKNVLLFMPVVFSFKHAVDEADAINRICKEVFSDIRSSIEFRNKSINGLDTYLATIYKDCMRFFKLYEDKMVYVDCVALGKSETYMKYQILGSFE